MPQPFVSIVVPLFNVADYVDEFLDSLLDQNHGTLEIVIVNDASTDTSLEKVTRKVDARKPSNIKIINHPENKGVSITRNTGLENATGEYIWYIDPDDVLACGAVGQVLEALHAKNPDILFFDFSILRKVKKIKHTLRGELHKRTFKGPEKFYFEDPLIALKGVFFHRQFHLWSRVIRRNLYGNDLRFEANVIYEDARLLPFLLIRAKSFFYVPSVIIKYRVREGSLLTSVSTEKLAQMSTTFDSFLEHTRSTHWHQMPEFRFILSRAILVFFLSGCQKLHSLPGAEAKALFADYAKRANDRLLLPYNTMMWEYAKRGWFWRLLRTQYWMRRSEKARDAMS